MRPAIALAAFVLLLALPLLHSAYTETLDVQVFDQDFRPVEGAEVYAEYQVNAVTGYAKTKPHTTNASGYHRLQFTDWESLESQVKYSYTLYVKWGDQLKQYSMIANPNATNWTSGKARVYTSQLNSYYLFVKVHDQKGKPLTADLTVSGSTISDMKKTTTESGDAIFQLPPGSFSLKAEREGAVKNKDFSLSKDTALEVTFGIYSFDVKVTDDSKLPLVATVEAGTQSLETGADGIAHFVNVSDDEPTVVVKYADRYKTYKPNLALGENLVAVFDLTRPAITDLHASVGSNGGATVTFFVEDSGSAASGIDTVSVSYDVAGVETPLAAYAVGYNTFEAKVPAQEPGTLVKYTVKIADKDGNAALGKGSYSVTEAAAPAPAPTPAPSPVPLPEVPATTGGLPTEMLVLLAVVALVVAYAAIYYFKRKREENFGGVQPPAIPPSQPPA